MDEIKSVKTPRYFAARWPQGSLPRAAWRNALDAPSSARLHASRFGKEGMNDQALRTIGISGGGTAGWMAAAPLALKLRRGDRPPCVIVLVESPAIGTLGEGEATRPMTRACSRGLGLDNADFERRTQAGGRPGLEFRARGRVCHRSLRGFGDFASAGEQATGLASVHGSHEHANLGAAAAQRGRRHRGHHAGPCRLHRAARTRRTGRSAGPVRSDGLHCADLEIGTASNVRGRQGRGSASPS
jgi:hypothetical protein